MAVISWTIPPGDLPRLVDALAATWGYQATLANGSPNPENKQTFVHRMQGDEWRRRTIAYERHIAQQAVPVPVPPDIT